MLALSNGHRPYGRQCLYFQVSDADDQSMRSECCQLILNVDSGYILSIDIALSSLNANSKCI